MTRSPDWFVVRVCVRACARACWQCYTVEAHHDHHDHHGGPSVQGTAYVQQPYPTTGFVAFGSQHDGAPPPFAPIPGQPTYAPITAQPMYAPITAQPTYAPITAQGPYAPPPSHSDAIKAL